MKKFALAFAGAMTLFAGSALADGMSRGAAPSYDTAKSWTGFYLGAGLGAGSAVHDLSVFGGAASLDGLGAEGMFGTIIVGYDRQLSNRIVAGIFAEYDFSNISTDASFGPISASVDHDSSWAIGARLGFLSSPTTLWYGTVGYTEAKWELNGSAFGQGFSFDLPDTKGYFVGGGVESQLVGNWGLRAEYRFTQFDSEEILGPFLSSETSMHTGRVALTYKFNRDEPARSPMK